MSDTNDSPRRTPLSGNRAARYLFMALLGLVVGVVATVMLLRALEARRDPYPAAVMQVMQAHTAAMKRSVTQNRCAATDVLPHLQILRQLSNDLEPAFADLRNEAEFVQHASLLRARIDAALANPPLSCGGLQATIAQIGEACAACHNDYAN